MLNVDNLGLDELEALIQKLEQNKNAMAIELFPDKNPGYVKATLTILKYAKSRLEMLDDLSKHREERAEKHKIEADKYYRILPDYAQWL